MPKTERESTQAIARRVVDAAVEWLRWGPDDPRNEGEIIRSGFANDYGDRFLEKFAADLAEILRRAAAGECDRG